MPAMKRWRKSKARSSAPSRKDASAILTDPTYGLNAAMQMSPKAGLLLALEKSGYSGDASYRKTELIPSWTPEKIRKAGASAVKFMVYYHPGSGALADELERLIRPRRG